MSGNPIYSNTLNTNPSASSNDITGWTTTGVVSAVAGGTTGAGGAYCFQVASGASMAQTVTISRATDEQPLKSMRLSGYFYTAVPENLRVEMYLRAKITYADGTVDTARIPCNNPFATTVSGPLQGTTVTWTYVESEVEIDTRRKMTNVTISAHNLSTAGPMYLDDFYLQANLGGEFADGTVTTIKLADRAVTNAKIDSLSADKINTGTLNAVNVNVSADWTKAGTPGNGFMEINGSGIRINDGTKDTFKVDTNGLVTLTGININGGNIQWGTGKVNPPTAADVGARPNTWMPTAADVGARPVSWMPTATDVNAVYNSQTAVFNTLTNNGTLPGLYMSGGQLYVNAGYIKTGTLTADYIRNGTLSSVDISVSSDVYIGESLIFSRGNASGGIRWGTAAFSAQIYYDPGANSIHFYTNGGSIYANSQRIDVAPVAVFG